MLEPGDRHDVAPCLAAQQIVQGPDTDTADHGDGSQTPVADRTTQSSGYIYGFPCLERSTPLQRPIGPLSSNHVLPWCRRKTSSRHGLTVTDCSVFSDTAKDAA